MRVNRGRREGGESLESRFWRGGEERGESIIDAAERYSLPNFIFY